MNTYATFDDVSGRLHNKIMKINANDQIIVNEKDQIICEIPLCPLEFVVAYISQESITYMCH